jgi:formylmethanofuran dehydrogenase subunit E-like metal-binding protein
MSIMGSASAADNSTYGVGVNVTQQAMANTNLALNQSNSNLVITTAGSAQLNGKTTEDSVQGVVDTTSSLSKGQAITHGSGNLLTINDPNGALWYLFVSKTGNSLWAQKYTVDKTGKITSTGVWNIGANQNSTQLKPAIDALGFNLVAIANLWAAGAPADLMAGTFTTGNIDAATISSYAMTRSFALTYPSLSNTESNYVITTAGGLDDDTLIYGAFGFNEILFSTSSGTPGETAFIHYNTNNNVRSGVLALMKENDLTSTFTAATGIKVVAGTWSEIQYDLWLLNKLTDASSLFTVEALKSVNEANIKYLWYDDSLGYGHGIDKTYIAGLSDASITWNTNVVPVTYYDAMFALGQQTFNTAYSSGLFSLEDLAAGNVAMVVAPYYVNLLNTYSLVGFIDGIVSAAHALLTANQAALTSEGYTNPVGFTIDNILQIRNPWTWGSNTGSSLTSVFVKVDRAKYLETRDIDDLVMSGVRVTSKYLSGSTNLETPASLNPKLTGMSTNPIFNVSPSQIPSGTVIGGSQMINGKQTQISGITIPAVAGIAYAWAGNAPYSYIRTISRVGCICSAREYEAAISAMGQFPLGSGGYYLLMALTQFGQNGLPSETNRQISARTTAYGVSPSLGTYYSVGRSSDSNYDSILIAWDSTTNTGTAALIRFDSSVFDTAMATAGYTSARYSQEATLFWFLDRVWNNGPDATTAAGAFTAARVVNNVDSTFVSNMAAAGQDPIKYILSYVAPVTPVSPVSPVNPSNSGTSTQTSVLAGIGATALNAVNGLNSLTTGTSTATSEVAPGLTTSPSTTPATGKTTATSNGSNLPLGAAAGAILIAIAAALIYLGRNTITGAIKSQKSEKLGK